MLKQKICVVTGSRAEYGLLYWILRGIQDSETLELQLVVTGMHLSNEFGYTIQEIERDGFQISRKVEMLVSSDSCVGVAKSTGLGIIGFADALEELKPDLVVLLGDRFEILSAACACLFALVPVAHIHGGEITQGAFDDAIRHSITKMSALHFTSTDEYRRRVIQLGEHPDFVFNVGAPGIDNINSLELLDRGALEAQLGIDLSGKSLLVTFHPATLEVDAGLRDFRSLLDALDQFPDVQLIFTKANADTNGRSINMLIDDYVGSRSSAAAFTSLGQLNYLSLLQSVDGVIGNSSSGLIEAPTFKVGTINIGDRQAGRVRADSIIDCGAAHAEILAAMTKLFSEKFQESLKSVENPHGRGGASRRIIDVLLNLDLSKLQKKEFFDLKVQAHDLLQ